MAEKEKLENFWEEPAPEENHAAAAVPTVPPPPPEVKIRTLKTDLDSMMKGGGGGMPRFQTVKAPALPAVGASADGGTKSMKSYLVAGIVIAVLAVAGLFAYKFFTPASAPQANESAPPRIPAPAPAQTPPASPPPASAFAHRSFLKKSDQVLVFSQKGAAENANDLQTASQRLTNLVNGASPTSTFSEVAVKNEKGDPLSISDFWAVIDGQVLDQGFLNAHFTPDFTMFVFRDKNGLWPGYILALKPGEAWLYLKNDVANLEKSSRLANLFLAYPGDQSPGGFKDAVEGGEPARILAYSNSGTSLVYGWFHGYLIMSTSEAGLAQALLRL